MSNDSERLDWLFRHLPFELVHQFGGDEREFREGIDASAASGKYDIHRIMMPRGTCERCVERAKAELDAGHGFTGEETFAALREGRDPVCLCGRTHPNGVWKIEPAT